MARPDSGGDRRRRERRGPPIAEDPRATCVVELEAEVQRLNEALADAQRPKLDVDAIETLWLTVANPGQTSQPRPERILLVEDHPFDRKVTQLMLSSLGYSSDHVSTGQEALTALERQRYDIVLMDVQMPMLDGIETTKLIRKRWPANIGPRIVALTSRSMKGDREVCLAAGMDDCMSKPVPLRVLDAKLRSEIQPLVDLKHIEHCAEMMGKPALGRMIESFLSVLPTQVGKLFEALSQGQADILADGAAALKACCEILGVRRLSAHATVLQRLAAAGRLATAAGVVSLIESLQTPLEHELRELRKRYA